MKNNKKTILSLAIAFAIVISNSKNGCMAFLNILDREEIQLQLLTFDDDDNDNNTLVLPKEKKEKGDVPLSKKEMKIQKIQDAIKVTENQRNALINVNGESNKELAILIQNENDLTELIKSENTWKNRRKKKAIMKKITSVKKAIDKNEDEIAKLEIKLINLRNDYRKFLA